MTWVALVERGGDCSFVAKVRNMQASGAAAVIVGDNQRNGLITMYARGKDPIFFVCDAASFFYCISCVYANCPFSLYFHPWRHPLNWIETHRVRECGREKIETGKNRHLVSPIMWESGFLFPFFFLLPTLFLLSIRFLTSNGDQNHATEQHTA